MTLRRRIIPLMLAILVTGVFLPSEARSGCSQRLLVLAATPTEIDKLFRQASLNNRATVTTEGRTFYVGRLGGNDVVLALTGVGLVNATKATQAALTHFRCGRKPAISGIVFSGSSGGHTYIGDVTVPSRWSLDNGTHWFTVDARMLATAKSVKNSVLKRLARDPPVGDLACVGIDPDLVRAIRFDHVPQIFIGGNARSSDPFGGREFPCVPAGNDVFGCQPCPAQPQAGDIPRFVSDAIPFVDPNFFFGYRASGVPPGVVAVDMETAAVGRVAVRNRIPFIAFRAISDGAKGDPFNLPNEPVPMQFFVYKQLASDNAATVALAFLQAWGARR